MKADKAKFEPSYDYKTQPTRLADKAREIGTNSYRQTKLGGHKNKKKR